jgi:hypothetical protein
MTLRGYSTRFAIIILLFSGKAFSQSDSTVKNSFFIEPIVHVGKIVKNYPHFPERGTSIFSEVNFAFQTNRGKTWHRIYNFPQFGFSFGNGILGNDSVLGRNYFIMPNISFNIPGNFKRWSIEAKIGSGFAYFDKFYNAQNDSNNFLIGSRVTAAEGFSLDLRVQLSSHLTLKTGFSTFHFSNGHYQLPNVGINTVDYNIGLKYFPRSQPVLTKRKKDPSEKYPLKFNVRVGAGVHEFGSEIGPAGGAKYPIYQEALYVSKRFGNISNVHAGVSTRYYTNYYKYIVDSSLYNKNIKLKSSAITVFLGHEFMCGRLSLLTQGGINVFNPFYIYYSAHRRNNIFKFFETYISSRLGFQYYLLDLASHRNNLYIGLSINANFGQADFDEISLGYTF